MKKQEKLMLKKSREGRIWEVDGWSLVENMSKLRTEMGFFKLKYS